MFLFTLIFLNNANMINVWHSMKMQLPSIGYWTSPFGRGLKIYYLHEPLAR